MAKLARQPSENEPCHTVEWTRGRYKGAIDFLPKRWFAAETVERNLLHEFLGTDGMLAKAQCSLRVAKDRATINYLTYADYNIKTWDDAGKFVLIFNDRQRKELVGVEWWNEDGKPEETYVALDEDKRDLDGDEGTPRLVTHIRYERDPKLRKAKIDDVLQTKKRLNCEACNFSFTDQYGPELAHRFCEVHHEQTVSSGIRKTKLKDLAVLCSNCHRMIHRTSRLDRTTPMMMSVKQFADEVVKDPFFDKGTDDFL